MKDSKKAGAQSPGCIYQMSDARKQLYLDAAMPVLEEFRIETFLDTNPLLQSGKLRRHKPEVLKILLEWSDSFSTVLECGHVLGFTDITEDDLHAIIKCTILDQGCDALTKRQKDIRSLVLFTANSWRRLLLKAGNGKNES